LPTQSGCISMITKCNPEDEGSNASEMLASNHPTTRRNNPKIHDFYSLRHENSNSAPLSWSLSINWIISISYGHVLDACALPRIMPSLSFTDMMYCTPEKKPTLASTFRLIWISLLHNVVKRVRSSTARFRCVVGSIEGRLNFRRILRIWLCAYLLSSQLHETFLYTTLSEVGFCKVWVSSGSVRWG
jgi:hypothetical protein